MSNLWQASQLVQGALSCVPNKVMLWYIIVGFLVVLCLLRSVCSFEKPWASAATLHYLTPHSQIPYKIFLSRIVPACFKESMICRGDAIRAISGNPETRPREA